MKQGNIRKLAECAILLAMSIALSFVTLYKMPMGGRVTMVSMLPILLVGLRHGWKWGLGTSMLYALYQLIEAIVGGNVFPYCTNAGIVVLCALFDYIVPFGTLGCSAVVCVKRVPFSRVKTCIVFGVLIFVRFVCHFITGVVIWDQWAPEGMGKFVYSLAYNGQYMLPELILTLAVTILLTASKPFVRLLKSNN